MNRSEEPKGPMYIRPAFLKDLPEPSKGSETRLCSLEGCGGVVAGLRRAIRRGKSLAYDRLGELRTAACTAADRHCIGRSIVSGHRLDKMATP